MKKKFKLVLILCVLTLCMALVACVNPTKVEELQKNGYKISVTYDGNGGSFLDRDGITIMDMFKPSQYEKDNNGYVHIRLTEPTADNRVHSGHGSVSLTMPNYFFAGWYKTRTVKTVDGSPVDENGEKLVLQENGTYVYADTVDSKEPKTGRPAYEYSDYWDFKNDTIDYREEDYASTNGVMSLTLYAGWVKHYEFNYYYQVEGESGWTKADEVTTFDYKTTNATDSLTSDKDTIWVPVWEDGAMNYEHKYSNGSFYFFPEIDGTTFAKAYKDENCTQEITDSLEHEGTLDIETGKAINRVQNVYIKLEKGKKYRIETADQLIAYANSDGIYEIKANLDFTDKKWPGIFSVNTFNGKMYSTEGNTFTIKNATATISSTAKACGLFGQVGANAQIKNLVFENATVDLSYVGERQRDRLYGTFAGNIVDGATISNVTISGLLKIGAITPGDGYNVNILTNGKTDGITNNGIGLTLYGMKRGEKYQYSIVDPGEVTVETDGTVNITIAQSIILLEQEKFDINIG